MQLKSGFNILFLFFFQNLSTNIQEENQVTFAINIDFNSVEICINHNYVQLHDIRIGINNLPYITIGNKILSDPIISVPVWEHL